MRILLVEDEKRMVQAQCEILRLEKYEVDHHDNGIDGLAAIEGNMQPYMKLDKYGLFLAMCAVYPQPRFDSGQDHQYGQ